MTRRDIGITPPSGAAVVTDPVISSAPELKHDWSSFSALSRFLSQGLTLGSFDPNIPDETRLVSDCTAMPTSTYTLFRKAIRAGQQVTCTYRGLHRELCPHIIGTNKRGEEAVLAWQFAGESSGKLPEWRCLRLSEVRNAHARDGRWHEGDSHNTVQTCVSRIDLDINIDVRKLR
jgi:hypothetical protein